VRFRLDSAGGRIGPLWWTNSTTTPTRLDQPGLASLAPLWLLWGQAGWGDQARQLLQSVRP